MDVRLHINGAERVADIVGHESLLTVLRSHLDLLGTKDACEQGECGSCSVMMDGEVVCACLVMAADAEGSEITTIEGLAPEGALGPVHEALLEHGAVQCGFCTPGFVVAATHLLESQPHPTRHEIREALSGNICRCTGYGAILRALEQLAGDAP
jgi:aerobic carbon-monoxide dehydrogenase small subunit